MIVAIEGIDGAGKTHISQLLVGRLQSRDLPVHLLQRAEIKLNDVFSDRLLSSLRSMIWPAEPEPPTDPFGTHFHLYLLAAWFVALRKCLPTEPAETGQIHVMDGSHFRVIAKAHLRGGLEIDWLTSLFAPALQPDIVVLLDIDPALAWTRRASFKATEIGRWDGFGSDPKTAFCAYQSAIRNVLMRFSARFGWSVIVQSPGATLEQIADRVEQSVVSRLVKENG